MHIIALSTIFIKCGQIDLVLEKLIKEIRLYGFSISGKKDGETHSIKIENIFYFESVDEKTYIYCEMEVVTGKANSGLILVPTFEIDASNEKKYRNSEVYTIRYAN